MTVTPEIGGMGAIKKKRERENKGDKEGKTEKEINGHKIQSVLRNVLQLMETEPALLENVQV